LAELYPITYTAPRWALCAAVRDLKDRFRARPDAWLARDIGAILSAYLEVQLQGGRLGPGEFGIVTTVPSSRPVIRAALRRAGQEGWWSCELATVARARPGHRRQRERPDLLRPYVCGKWDVDRAAVSGLDVLVLDDIYTSGGSVQSLAHALRNAGAASVRGVVLARNLGVADTGWILSLLRARHDAGQPWTAATNKHDVINAPPASPAAAGVG
jgi:predicted amidophosphoribosyltransferase